MFVWGGGGEANKIKLKRTLVWNRDPITSKSAPNTSTMACQTTQTPGGKPRNLYFSQPAKAGDSASSHSALAPIQTIPTIPLSYTSAGIVTTGQRLCRHTEQFCRRKGLSTKSGGGRGLSQTTPKVLDMNSCKDNNDVDRIVNMDNASDQSLWQHPRLQATCPKTGS